MMGGALRAETVSTSETAATNRLVSIRRGMGTNASLRTGAMLQQRTLRMIFLPWSAGQLFYHAIRKSAITYSFVVSMSAAWTPAILAVLDPTANQRES